MAVREDAERPWKPALVLALVPFGFTTWAAFVYMGVRSGVRRYFAWAAAYFGVFAAAIAVNSADEPVEGLLTDISVVMILAVWAVGAIHVGATRSTYLTHGRRAADRRIAAARGRLAEREEGRRLVAEEPELARELGVGRPDRRGAFHAGLVDVNGAPAAVIAELPEVDGPLAGRIVAAREELGGFSSVEDLGHVLDLPARTVEALRPVAVFLRR